MSSIFSEASYSKATDCVCPKLYSESSLFKTCMQMGLLPIQDVIRPFHSLNSICFGPI